MGLGYISGAGGGGGVTSDDVTASRADVLTGKTTITTDSGDEVVQGTMPNNGAVNQTLGINGSYTIPEGYHNGSGRVTQNISTKPAATYYATLSDQTITGGQYLSGNQVIKKLTSNNLIAGNIKPGVKVTVHNGNTDIFSVTGNMASKEAATYGASTSDQTISSGQYLSGAQTIKKVTQSNLSASNVKNGTTVTVSSNGVDLYSVTGTFSGNKHPMCAVAWIGFGTDPEPETVSDFTMPRDGIVYYGGISTFYGGSGTGTVEIYKNNTRMDHRNGGEGFAVRATMINKSFTASKNDIITVKATATTGNATLCFIQAVCVY